MKRKTFNKIRRGFLITFGVVFLVGIFYIYFRTHAFTITTYELVGVPDMYKETIESKLNIIASQKRYKILPSNRVLNYNSKAIKSTVVEVLPNSEKVSLLPVGLHTLRVNVISHEPIFKIDEVRGITKDGIIYTEFKDMSNLPKISTASSTRKEIVKDGIRSTKIVELDNTKLNNLSLLINKINSVIFRVSKIEIDAYGDVAFYNESGLSKVMFSGITDIDKVWSNLVSAIDTEPLKSKLLNSKDKLEYLDARFGNKVFYKFTNNSKTAIIQSYATPTATTTFSR